MSNWISVKDILPEKEGAYLCYCSCFGSGFQRVVNFILRAEMNVDLNFRGHKGRAWFCRSAYGDYVMDNVTHWMPLPEDPKEESDV